MNLSLEIHHVGISGGDSTAIVVRDLDKPTDKGWENITFKVLIDAGGEDYDRGMYRLGPYLKRFFGNRSFDYIIASHYHDDHIAGFAQSGITFKKFIDIGGYAAGLDWFNPYNPMGDLSQDSTSVTRYQQYVHNEVIAGKASRHELPFIKHENYDAAGRLKDACKGPVKIELGAGTNIWLTCYCASGILADGTNVLRQNIQTRILRLNNKPEDGSGLNTAEQHDLEKFTKTWLQDVSPNDLSIGMILEWGDFRYFSCGDLSGDLSLMRYYNIEEALVRYLRDTIKTLNANGKPITVLKATHHGSNHNNYPKEVSRKVAKTSSKGEDQDTTTSGKNTKPFKSQNGLGFLDELQPTTIIVPANQMKGVPGAEFLQRAGEYCQHRNTALKLSDTVLADLKTKPYSQVLSALESKRGAQTNTAQHQLVQDEIDKLKKLATVAFINYCAYPPLSYAKKQKAKKADLTAFLAKTLQTNLAEQTSALSNVFKAGSERPVAIVVVVPSRGADTILPKPAGTSEIDKGSHRLIFVSHNTKTHKEELQSTAIPQLPELTTDLKAAVENAIELRQAEIENLMQLDEEKKETKGIEFVRQQYPSVVESTAGGPHVDPGRLSWMSDIFGLAYPDSGFDTSSQAYQPSTSGLSFHDRDTIAGLIRNTLGPPPRDPDTPLSNVLGLRLQSLPYNCTRKRKAEDPPDPAGDGRAAEARPQKKRRVIKKES